MEAVIQLPQPAIQSAVKMTETTMGTFGALTSQAVNYGFDPTNFANQDTALLIFAIDSAGKRDKFVLSKELSREYYAKEIEFNQLLDLDVRLAISDAGEEIKIIAKPSQMMTFAANKVVAKPYKAKTTLSEADVLALANVSI